MKQELRKNIYNYCIEKRLIFTIASRIKKVMQLLFDVRKTAFTFSLLPSLENKK